MAELYTGTVRQSSTVVLSCELGRERGLWKESLMSVREKGGEESQSASDPSYLQGSSLGKVCFYAGNNYGTIRDI